MTGVRQRLVLHIGTHKTGTTTIQNYFYLNRLWLRYMGVYYPRPINGPLFFTNNHRDLRDTARIEGKPGRQSHLQFGGHDRLLAAYVNRIKDTEAPLSILSCEGWSSVLNSYAHRLAPLTTRFDVKIIAFLRRPDHWAESFYRQRLANREHREVMTFAEFVRQPPMETYLFDRYSLFSWWAEAFGAENISVLPYEPALRNFDLLSRFCDAAGIPDGLQRQLLFRRSRFNKTISAKAAENLRQEHLAERQCDDSAAAFPYLSDADRKDLLSRAAPDLGRIARAFIRDGRATAFPTDPE